MVYENEIPKRGDVFRASLRGSFFMSKIKAGENMAIETTQEDIQLLNKYLTKLYDAKQAKQLLLEHKDNLFGRNGLAFALGKRSIPFFCLYYLQDTFRVKEDNAARKLADFHFEVWNELEDMVIRDEFDRLVLVLPRGQWPSITVM